MRRLYLKIYVAFLAVGMLALILSGSIATALFGRPSSEIAVASEIGVAVGSLPPVGDPAFSAAFRKLSDEVEHDLAMFDAHGVRLAGAELPMGEPGLFRHRARAGLRLQLPDGRTVAVLRRPDNSRRGQLLAWLSVVAAVIAAGCLPIARGITRRLEALQAGMSQWGQGELHVRVEVEGEDEVADLARTFNDAADRVQQLFDAQQRVLASVSHDLRTPLTRLRMALELLSEGAPPKDIIPDAVSDVEELDGTVGDILQVARMQADDHPRDPVPVDLLELARSEAASVGATVTGPGHTVMGDPKLLRRMLRNLLENAHRHGQPPIEVLFMPQRLEVLDRGRGVPEAFRERIFEPFFRPPGHAQGRDGSVGLGLHLVRQIARFHGGDVAVTEREGGGSRFVVTLP
jgi:two-component system OmpR family sensor kinase